MSKKYVPADIAAQSANTQPSGVKIERTFTLQNTLANRAAVAEYLRKLDAAEQVSLNEDYIRDLRNLIDRIIAILGPMIHDPNAWQVLPGDLGVLGDWWECCFKHEECSGGHMPTPECPHLYCDVNVNYCDPKNAPLQPFDTLPRDLFLNAALKQVIMIKKILSQVRFT